MKIVIAWVLNAISVEMGVNDIFFKYKHIPVDAEFYAESEFEVKKNFRPRIFEKIRF